MTSDTILCTLSVLTPEVKGTVTVLQVTSCGIKHVILYTTAEARAMLKAWIAPGWYDKRPEWESFCQDFAAALELQAEL